MKKFLKLCAFRSSVWTHLKILGMDNLSADFSPQCGLLHSGSGFPLNRVLLQSSGLSLFEELILSSPEVFSGLIVGENECSWLRSCSPIISNLQRFFCPIFKDGETIVPIVKHLLFGARVIVIPIPVILGIVLVINDLCIILFLSLVQGTFDFMQMSCAKCLCKY